MCRGNRMRDQVGYHRPGDGEEDTAKDHELGDK